MCVSGLRPLRRTTPTLSTSRCSCMRRVGRLRPRLGSSATAPWALVTKSKAHSWILRFFGRPAKVRKELNRARASGRGRDARQLLLRYSTVVRLEGAMGEILVGWALLPAFVRLRLVISGRPCGSLGGQAGSPSEIDVDHAKRVLEHTLLRHHREEGARRSKSQELAKEVLEFFDGDWRTGRLCHRCRQLPRGAKCCPNRLLMSLFFELSDVSRFRGRAARNLAATCLGEIRLWSGVGCIRGHPRILCEHRPNTEETHRWSNFGWLPDLTPGSFLYGLPRHLSFGWFGDPRFISAGSELRGFPNQPKMKRRSRP